MGTPPTRTVERRGHPGQPIGAEGLQHDLGADDADDGAHDSAADERLPAVGLDVGDDVGDVALGGARRHDDDHGQTLATATGAFILQ